MIKCQCSYCFHRMAVPESMAGRRILCPLCHDPFTIPQAGIKITLRPFNLADAIPKIQWSEWDRALARFLLEAGRFAEQALYDHIVSFVKARSALRDISLAEFLQSQGAISRDEAERLREVLRGTVKTAKANFIECANCFARIIADSRACKFCGQRLGDPAVDICPRCKHEQKKGGCICERCHANLKTGIVEAVARCPACGRLVIGGPRSCPSCKAILQKPGERRAVAEAQQRRRARFAAALTAAFVIIATGLILGRKPLALAWRARSVGYGQASLEQQAANLCAALVKGRAEEIAAFLNQAAQGMNMPQLAALLAAASDREKIERIASATIAQAMVADDETSGATTVELKIALAAEDADDMPPLAAKAQKRTVTWRWRRGAGGWRWQEARREW